jgi:hypothetical protein
MGLDVSLKYCADRATEIAKQEAAEEFSSAAWEKAGKYDDLSDAQRETVRAATKAYNEANDLDEWGSSNKIQDICSKSAKFPEHMFEVGYLRSSYNEGGINSVLKRAGCMDLYDIFKPEDGEYYVDIDWTAAQERCDEAIIQFREHLTGPMAGYDVTRVSNFGSNGVSDASEALAILKEQLEKHPAGNGFRSYGCREGDFYLDGLEIVGVIPNCGFGGGVFLLTKDKKVEAPEDNWYMQALIVTKEMIDFVVAQPDPDNYFLGWSA